MNGSERNSTREKGLRRCLCMAGLVIAFGAHLMCFAQGPQTMTTISGYGAIQCGEIVKGTYQSINLDHQWQQFIFGGFDLTARVNKNLTIVFGSECELAQSVYTLDDLTDYSSDIESSHAFFVFYLNQMQGIFSFGDSADPYLQFRAGYFRYNYNKNVKSLGEYLFRTIPYPGCIINRFASPYQRLPGVMLNAQPLKGLSIDALLTSEVLYPVGDFTPSLVASYSYGRGPESRIFDIGAGVSLTRFLPVNPALTTPKVPGNFEVTNIDTLVNDPADPFDDVITGDTTYYSRKAVKLMAFFSFDIKQIIGNPGIFGREDLKIYGESCLLGLKSYQNLYTDPLRRLPVMLGFNIPAFNLLDVFSAEVEWYDNEFVNNYHNLYFPRFKVPLPYNYSASIKPFAWYWDIHLAKTVTGGFKVLGEVGRTHYFTKAKLPIYLDKAEQCPRKGDWQFTTMMQYSF